MGNKTKKLTKPVNGELTNQVKMDFTKKFYSTRGEILTAAVNHFQTSFPALTARKVVAAKLGMDESMLSLVLNDKRPIPADKQDLLFSVTMYPIGYDHLKELTFLTNTEIKK